MSSLRDSTSSRGSYDRGFSEELRVEYDEEPDIVVMDDCAVIDFLLGRERRSHDKNSEQKTIGDVYYEGSEDVAEVLDKTEPEIKRPWIDEGYRAKARSLRDERMQKGKECVSLQVLEERLNELEDSTGFIETWNIEPREGFSQAEDVEHHDKVMIEYAYRMEAVIATYDDDMLQFPVNYTTPAMLV
jgi:hypothetical protein